MSKEEITQNENEKNTKKTTKKPKPDKTLIELVENSSVKITSIVMDLSKHGLIDQYYDEVTRKKQGLPINPSLTEVEFKKIIGE